MVRTEVSKITDEVLHNSDLVAVRQAMYRQKRKKYPVLPKNRIDVHECLENLKPSTSKKENFLYLNATDTGMVVFTCETNGAEAYHRSFNSMFYHSSPNIVKDGEMSFMEYVKSISYRLRPIIV